MVTKIKPRLRALIALVLVLVSVAQLGAFPAGAADTSTEPRIYSFFSTAPAYQNYQEFAQLYVQQYATAIPGLAHTDVNGQDCTTMVPQGICIAGDYMIISAYDASGQCDSVLYVLSNTNPASRKYLTTLVLPNKAHVGGIAFDGSYLWVSNGRDVSSIQYTELVNAVD